MCQEFVEKVTKGFDGGHYKVDLHDHVVVFCCDGVRAEGELLGFCPEGLVVASDSADMWINSEAILVVAKVRSNGGGGGGGGREGFVSPGPARKKKKAASDGTATMEKVFCNGTRGG